MSKNGGLGYTMFRIRRESDSYPYLSDIERDVDIRGTVTELVDGIRTNTNNEENSGSHAFPGPTSAMG